MEYVDSLLELVGNTPLLRLAKTTDGAKPTVLAKMIAGLDQLSAGRVTMGFGVGSH